MPTVLIIGDSISIGYTPTVAVRLAGTADVVHNPGNGGDSANILAHLNDWLGAAGPPDLVCLNCGLHDLKRDRTSGRCQVPPDQYRANLLAILDKLRSADCRVVWVTTTPVIDERHQAVKDFDRHNADVVEYNALAAALMEEAGVPVVDLNAAANELDLDAALPEDGVHFTADAYEKLGQFVADRLREHIG